MDQYSKDLDSLISNCYLLVLIINKEYLLVDTLHHNNYSGIVVVETDGIY